jgi:hypothetical protein
MKSTFFSQPISLTSFISQFSPALAVAEVVEAAEAEAAHPQV